MLRIRMGQLCTLVSAFCQGDRESQEEKKKDKETVSSNSHVSASSPRPRRLGDVDGRTPARSTAITFGLTLGLTAH